MPPKSLSTRPLSTPEVSTSQTPVYTTNELLYFCRKIRRQTRCPDTFSIANALEARVVDEMSAGWGWPQTDRTCDIGRRPRWTSVEELQFLAEDILSRTRDDHVLETVCKELLSRIALDTAPEAESDESEDAPPNRELLPGETKEEARKRYKRDWIKAKRIREGQ